MVCADLVACSAIYKLLTINIQASLLHESFMGQTSILEKSGTPWITLLGVGHSTLVCMKSLNDSFWAYFIMMKMPSEKYRESVY